MQVKGKIKVPRAALYPFESNSREPDVFAEYNQGKCTETKPLSHRFKINALYVFFRSFFLFLPERKILIICEPKKRKTAKPTLMQTMKTIARGVHDG